MQAMQERLVQSLGPGDPLEEEMATHSSILAGKIPWTEEPGWLQSIGSQRVGHDWVTQHTSTFVELTRNVLTRPTCEWRQEINTAALEADQNQEMFDFTPSPFSIKEAWILT